jgi:hypothetical protein
MGKLAMISVLVVAIMAATAWVVHFSKQIPTSNRGNITGENKVGQIDPVNPKDLRDEPVLNNAGSEAPSTRPTATEKPPAIEVADPGSTPAKQPTIKIAKKAKAKRKKTTDPAANNAKPKDKTNRAAAQANLVAARQLWLEGNHAAAEQAAKAALRADPRATEASAILTRVRNERRANKQLLKAMQAKQYGHWKNVLRYSKKGLKYKAGATVREALMGLRAEAGRQLAAQQRVKNAEPKDKDDGKPSKLDRAREFAKQAKTAKRSSNLPLAEKLYRQCLKAHAGMASCRANLAVILMARSKRCEALKHMRRYVKNHPGSSKAVQFNRLIEQFEPQCN